MSYAQFNKYFNKFNSKWVILNMYYFSLTHSVYYRQWKNFQEVLMLDILITKLEYKSSILKTRSDILRSEYRCIIRIW